MINSSSKSEIYKYLGTIWGGILFALALNLIIFPQKLYSGTIMGVAQTLKTILVDLLGIPSSKNFDVTGVIFYSINIPLFLLAYKEISRPFFFKTLLTVTVQSFVMSIIPIPIQPIIEDPLTSCILGGLIAGYGVSISLKHGGSGGGADIICVYCTKKFSSLSIGKMSLLISGLVFSFCVIMYDLEIVIYSIIYTAIYAITIDKYHAQNIKTSVLIFTKNSDVAECIIKRLHRGATMWEGKGVYTLENTYIFMTAISKYEITQLKQEIKLIDPKAFIIFNDGIQVLGNFDKRI